LSPKILVTTAHRTNPRVRSLAKELALSLPDAIKMNRGKMNYIDLFEYAKSLGIIRVIVVCRGLRGNPGRIIFLDTTAKELCFYPLILKLRGVKLAREMGVRPSPPRRAAVVAPGEVDAMEFGQELSGALNLTFVEGVEARELAGTYDSVLLIEPVRSPRASFAVKFVDPSTLAPRGPRLLVEKYYLRRPEYPEYDAVRGVHQG